MTITVEAFTGTATIGTTENSMTTNTAGPDTETTSGIFQAFIDLNAVVAGDIFEFKVYEKTITGGTQRAVYSATFANAQGTPIYASPCLILGIGWDMTLTKLTGTDRSIVWRISKVS